MKMFAFIVRGTVAIVALVVLAFFAMGHDRFWHLFGDPDLGPVAFESLQRSATPNDALACPPDLCVAPADITTRVYPVSAGVLRAAFVGVIAAEPRVTQVASDDATLTDRYVQRSARLGFPDTIVVRFIDRPGGQSTIALYSRSQIGHGDLGVNRARLERWLATLDLVLPATE
jgi:uncharacterized protein (DUF1499 family)